MQFTANTLFNKKINLTTAGNYYDNRKEIKTIYGF